MEVRVKNLTKQFGKTTAVNHIDVVFKDGKLTGLLGPSGCGKSTTLYMIAGLEGVTDGEIMFGDRDVTTLMPEKRNIGLVFQNYALYPHMTVRDNITFPLSNIKDPETGRPYSRAKRNAATDEIAKLVQIESLLDRKPGQLSGGQQQRVAIARALVKKPDVLLLDEPLSNLDARLRMEMRSEIRRIQQESKVTTIFVTHDQEEAMSITDEIVLMRQGVVQQVAGPMRCTWIPPTALWHPSWAIRLFPMWMCRSAAVRLFWKMACVCPADLTTPDMLKWASVRRRGRWAVICLSH